MHLSWSAFETTLKTTKHEFIISSAEQHDQHQQYTVAQTQWLGASAINHMCISMCVSHRLTATHRVQTVGSGGTSLRRQFRSAAAIPHDFLPDPLRQTIKQCAHAKRTQIRDVLMCTVKWRYSGAAPNDDDDDDVAADDKPSTWQRCDQGEQKLYFQNCRCLPIPRIGFSHKQKAVSVKNVSSLKTGAHNEV